jgi:hypothetical protein
MHTKRYTSLCIFYIYLLSKIFNFLLVIHIVHYILRLYSTHLKICNPYLNYSLRINFELDE